MTINEPLKYISLYSGCGGMDLGFSQAGFKGIKSFEIDKTASSTHSFNLDSDCIQFDLKKFTDEHVHLVAGCNLLIAGPPCQGFSTAGRNDPNDERNDHVANVARIASIVKPKLVIIENVRGLLAQKNSKHLDKTISLLRASGYSVTYGIHDLSDYGIPQKRIRVLIVATLSPTPFEIRLPNRPKTSLSDALRGVAEVGDFKRPSLDIASNEMRIASKIQPGQKLSNVRSGANSVHTWRIPDVYGEVDDLEVSVLETLVRLRRQSRRRSFGDADPVLKDDIISLFGDNVSGVLDMLKSKGYIRYINEYIDICNTFNGKYRRLQWDSVSPTVDTRFGQPRYFLHPEENRGFCAREAARIQGFPDVFTFQCSETAKFRMIGNAVPPPFAKMVAEAVLCNWKNI